MGFDLNTSNFHSKLLSITKADIPAIELSLGDWKAEHDELIKNDKIEQAAEIKKNRIMLHHALLCHLDWRYEIKCTRIKNLSGKQTFIRPYFYQDAILDYIQECDEKGKACKIQILKARKMGFSTIVAAAFYIRTKRNAGASSVILAHQDKASSKLFEIYENIMLRDTFQDVVFDGSILSRKPKVRRKQGNPGLDYDDVAKGGIDIATAKSPDQVRSFTTQCLHSSECCFYDNGAKVMAAVSDIIGNEGGLVSILESTGKAGTVFEGLWKSDDSPYKKFFFAWHENPKATMAFDDARQKLSFERTMSGYERGIREKFNLSLEQLNWWRMKYTEQNSNLAMTMQEQPSSPEEAFQSGSRRLFQPGDYAHIEREVEKIKLEEERLCTQEMDSGVNVDPKKHFLSKYVISGTDLMQNNQGDLWVYQWPQAGATYVIGADVAECRVVGEDSGNSNTTDFSAAVVIKRPDVLGGAEVVATYMSRVIPEDFVTHLDVVGSLYNYATINCEINGPGLVVVKNLKRISGYANLAREISIDKSRPNVLAAPSHKEAGFRTTASTRPWLFREMIGGVLAKSIRIPCSRLLDQLKTMGLTDSGRPEAEYGYHDDLVMAFGIAWLTYLYCRPKMPGHRSPIDSMLMMCDGHKRKPGQKYTQSGLEELRKRMRRAGIPSQVIDEEIRDALSHPVYIKTK
jgi:hypothetical protein